MLVGFLVHLMTLGLTIHKFIVVDQNATGVFFDLLFFVVFVFPSLLQRHAHNATFSRIRKGCGEVIRKT